MLIGSVRREHPDVREVVPTDHCLLRFRRRRGVREAGTATAARALLRELEEADITRWPPGWVAGEREAELWAIAAEAAYPLRRAGAPGRYVALTCLTRS